VSHFVDPSETDSHNQSLNNPRDASCTYNHLMLKTNLCNDQLAPLLTSMLLTVHQLAATCTNLFETYKFNRL